MSEVQHITELLEQIYDGRYCIGAIHKVGLGNIKIVLEERNNKDVEYVVYGETLSIALEEALIVVTSESDGVVPLSDDSDSFADWEKG